MGSSLPTAYARSSWPRDSDVRGDRGIVLRRVVFGDNAFDGRHAQERSPSTSSRCECGCKDSKGLAALPSRCPAVYPNRWLTRSSIRRRAPRHRPLRDIPAEDLLLPHRHYMWANQRHRRHRGAACHSRSRQGYAMGFRREGALAGHRPVRRLQRRRFLAHARVDSRLELRVWRQAGRYRRAVTGGIKRRGVGG